MSAGALGTNVTLVPPAPSASALAVAPDAKSASVTLDVKTTPLSVASRTAQINRYRSREDSNVNAAAYDLELVSFEWGKRLQKSIANEADRTNNWSLLWKAEAIYEAMDEQLQQQILDIIRDGTSAVAFGTKVANICTLNSAEHLAMRTKWNALPNTNSTKRYFENFYLHAKECEAFQQEMLVMLNRNRKRLDDRLSSDGGRQGGAVDNPKFITMLEFWILRQEASKAADEMFAELSRWTGCDGKLKIPSRRPQLEGFNNLSSRIVEWLIWPFLSPGVFPMSRQVLLYGPPGSGKTVVSQLVAYDIAEGLLWASIKNLSLNEKVQQRASADLNKYITFYFVDALKLRSTDPEIVGAKLRNYLNCLQYEVLRDKTRQKTRKMGLLLLDNMDTLFVSDDELRRQPRSERKSSQIKSWIYKASPDVIARLGGQNQNPITKTETAPMKVGGSGSGRSMADVLASILSPQALETEFPDVRLIWSCRYVWKLPPMLQSYVRQRQLFVDLPSAKIRRSQLESMLTDELCDNLANRWIEVFRIEGLINDRKRESEVISRDLQLPQRPEKKKELQDQKTLANGQAQYLRSYLGYIKPSSDPDQGLYAKETALRNGYLVNGTQLVRTFYNEYDRWDRLPLKPTPGNILRSIIQGDANLRRLLQDYLNAMSDVLDFITTASGMSLEGYCKLQTELGLSFSEVDMFLITTGKKRDGFAGSTPFGYTLEDLQNYFIFLKATVNQRLLKQALQRAGAFFLGSTRYASDGCRLTAADSERKQLDTGSSLDPASVTIWKSSGGEETTCEIALGPDTTDIKTGLPVIPLWARFGSHRILKIDDAMSSLNNFERYVTPKPDYPEFVNYVLFRVPRLNRPLLPPSQISQMCRARPGPAATFLSNTGVLSPTFLNQNFGTLNPWSVLFSPVPRIAGAARKRTPSNHLYRRRNQKTPSDNLPIDDLFKLH